MDGNTTEIAPKILVNYPRVTSTVIVGGRRQYGIVLATPHLLRPQA